MHRKALPAVGAPSQPPKRWTPPPCDDRDPVACTNGCGDGLQADCVHLGRLLLEGELVSIDPPRARALLLQACSDGQVGGCMRLAEAFDRGLFVDAAQQAKLHEQGCALGASEGCVRAGLAYAVAAPDTFDPRRARQLLDRACSKGHSGGCFELGRLWLRGEGGPSSRGKAEEHFQHGCALGNQASCQGLVQLERTVRE